jgi:hypothetical protein
MVQSSSKPEEDMGKFLWLSLAALFIIGCAVLGLTGCAGFGLNRGNNPGGIPEAAASSESSRNSPADQGPPAERLDSPAFIRLPPEARSYLGDLAQAFRSQDTAFLLAQGEPQYEAALRHRYDEYNYLALLYRFGPLAREYPDDRDDIPQLDPREIRGIEYVSWEETGPLLEIRGRLITKAGSAVPCVIMFNPRLKEPKILGVSP